MSDARAEYESAIDAAFDHCDLIVTNAYDKLRADCSAAWYTYQVRTGTVGDPAAEQTEGASDGDSASYEGHGDSDRVSAGQSVPRQDGSEVGDGRAQDPEEGSASNEAAS